MRYIAIAAAAMVGATPAMSADVYGDPVPIIDPVQDPVYDVEIRGSNDVATSAWENVYIKGTIGYTHPVMDGIDYDVIGGTKVFDTYDLSDTWSAGAGVGYQFNRFFRTDLMLNYISSSKFVGSTSDALYVSQDLASWGAYSLIASVYVDLDFFGGGGGGSSFIPFVGGGVGGTYVTNGNLTNQACLDGDPTQCQDPFVHPGEDEWRFSWEVSGGFGYAFRCDLVGEAAYTYQRIEGGNMFGVAGGAGPGYDRGIDIHSVQAGLRFYPARDCDPEPEPYIPPYIPPVYK